MIKRSKKTYKNKKSNKLFSFLKAVFLAGIFIAIMGFGFFLYILKDLPRPEVFSENQINQATKIYDRTGEVLLSSIYGEEKRTYVDIENIPLVLKQAVIATEDAKFYQHYGIDISGILRALKVNLKDGSLSQGGSTITQQLIRSTFLTPQKTIERKVKEIILALELDRRYSKDQILEWYLNQVPFGINIYGAEEASLTYFQKNLSEINLEEAALLAALIQSPSYYYPYGDHFDDLLVRKDYVLNRMAQENFITQEEADQAKEKEIELSPLPKTLAAHFVEFVKKQIQEEYGEDFLQVKGFKIYTTLDYDLQQKTEEIVKNNKERLNLFGAYNAASVIMDPDTGEVLSMIGSIDPWAESYPQGCDPTKDCKFTPSFNVATMGKRQPGSSFKPFVYAQAFINGYSDQTTVIDEPTDFGVYGGESYAPQNYDGKYRGEITLREALAQSLNVPAVKVLKDMAGVEESINLATKMGITTLIEDSSFYGLSLVLGGGEVKLIDMVSAYSVFANGGYKVSPSVILKIEDSEGNIVYQNSKTPRKIIESDTCQLITDILSDNDARSPMFGENSILKFDNTQVSVKTGTTQEYVDGWTIGYTQDATVGVWVGNNDNSSMKAYPGVNTAGYIWREIIEETISSL